MKVKTLVLSLLNALEKGGSREDKREVAAIRRQVSFAEPARPASRTHVMKGGKR